MIRSLGNFISYLIGRVLCPLKTALSAAGVVGCFFRLEEEWNRMQTSKKFTKTQLAFVLKRSEGCLLFDVFNSIDSAMSQRPVMH